LRGRRRREWRDRHRTAAVPAVQAAARHFAGDHGRPSHHRAGFPAGYPAPDVLVAHNCEFEQRFISGFASNGLPWICTHKTALRVWPDAPRHSNQVLRYWRGLVLDEALAMPPHRAGPDAWVTAHLLAELLEGASAEEMIEWASQPGKLPNITFGKHKGTRWPDVPTDYLHWMTRQKDMNADAVFCANEEIARRNAG
jgi:exodeoxyribonuclease X